MYEKGLWKNGLHTLLSYVSQGNKGFGDLLNIDFVRKRFDSPREHYTIMLLTYWGN